MSVTPDTSTEGFERPPVGDGVDDFLRLPDWNTSEPRMQSAAERAFALLALAADPNPDPSDWNGPGQVIMTKDWSLAEQEARRREEIAPTIDHKPVVTLFDRYGNERILTKPLAPEERFDQATITDPTKRAKFEKWIKGNRAAKESRGMTSMMEFACRVIDGELEKPKRKSAPKIEDDPAKALAQTDAIERAKLKREKPARERQRRKDRRERFIQNGKVIRADRTYLPFSEEFEGTGLRTELGLYGPAIFSSRIAKGAAYGKDKREVYDGSEIEPIFLRDMEYLVAGWDKVRGHLVVDLDGRLDGRKWKTRGDLRRDLVEILGVDLLPTMAPYRLDKEGNIDGAHLFWVLPPGSEVGVCGKSKTAPVRMHSMIQDALIAALMPLGADPGHTNTPKTKNPLAPRWSLMCFENFPDLTKLASGLPTLAVDRKEMRRRHAQLKRKSADEERAEPSQSNLRYNTMNDCWKEAITEGFRTHDQTFLSALKAKSSTAYSEWLKAAGIPRILEALNLPPDTELPEDVRKILHKQITWRCANRPSINTRYYDGDNRGRDKQAQEAEGLVGAELPAARNAQGKQRRELAGTITRANQGAASRTIIEEQLGLFVRIGGDLSDDEAVARFIIRSGKLGKSTVYKWLPDLLTRFRDASRYIARDDIRLNDQPSIHPEAIPETMPSAPAPSINLVVNVASEALTTGKPGQDQNTPPCRPPASSSSEHSCPPCPAKRRVNWLHFGGQRVEVVSDSMIHADHHSIQ